MPIEVPAYLMLRCRAFIMTTMVLLAMMLALAVLLMIAAITMVAVMFLAVMPIAVVIAIAIMVTMAMMTVVTAMITTVVRGLAAAVVGRGAATVVGRGATTVVRWCRRSGRSGRAGRLARSTGSTGSTGRAGSTTWRATRLIDRRRSRPAVALARTRLARLVVVAVSEDRQDGELALRAVYIRVRQGCHPEQRDSCRDDKRRFHWSGIPYPNCPCGADDSTTVRTDNVSFHKPILQPAQYLRFLGSYALPAGTIRLDDRRIRGVGPYAV